MTDAYTRFLQDKVAVAPSYGAPIDAGAINPALKPHQRMIVQWMVDGTDYAIADIGLRMLTPRELFRAQGFPYSYVIDVGANGRRLPKDAQVRACGNSVCPPLARALVAANLADLINLYAQVAA